MNLVSDLVKSAPDRNSYLQDRLKCTFLVELKAADYEIHRYAHVLQDYESAQTQSSSSYQYESTSGSAAGAAAGQELAKRLGANSPWVPILGSLLGGKRTGDATHKGTVYLETRKILLEQETKASASAELTDLISGNKIRADWLLAQFRDSQRLVAAKLEIELPAGDELDTRIAGEMTRSLEESLDSLRRAPWSYYCERGFAELSLGKKEWGVEHLMRVAVGFPFAQCAAKAKELLQATDGL
jgi:hypothetical protein